MTTLTSPINLAWRINLIKSFCPEARSNICSSYSSVWDQVWTEANSWKVWFRGKDGTVCFF